MAFRFRTPWFEIIDQALKTSNGLTVEKRYFVNGVVPYVYSDFVIIESTISSSKLDNNDQSKLFPIFRGHPRGKSF